MTAAKAAEMKSKPEAKRTVSTVLAGFTDW